MHLAKINNEPDEFLRIFPRPPRGKGWKLKGFAFLGRKPGVSRPFRVFGSGFSRLSLDLSLSGQVRGGGI